MGEGKDGEVAERFVLGVRNERTKHDRVYLENNLFFYSLWLKAQQKHNIIIT